MVRDKTPGRLLPGILAAAFAGTLAVSIVLTAMLLDSFLIRFDRGSVTTMLPGFAYGNALILKVGLIQAALLGVFAFATLASGRGSTRSRPVWGMVSVILYALAPLIGTLVVLVTQSAIDKPTGDTFTYFASISRIGVFALLATLFIAIASAVVSIIRREQPIGPSIIAVVINAIVIAVFVYWEFYKFGFDQDRWNNI
ncbi:MAG TPA: hypothetical protein VJV05_11075 [Pyrinomonadaceae bacterium]|nr:hypothetical protein [Pyrinomonadaceae bacterium]